MRNDSHDEKTFPKARSFEVRAAFCRFVSAFIFFRVGALALFFLLSLRTKYNTHSNRNKNNK